MVNAKACGRIKKTLVQLYLPLMAKYLPRQVYQPDHAKRGDHYTGSIYI